MKVTSEDAIDTWSLKSFKGCSKGIQGQRSLKVSRWWNKVIRKLFGSTDLVKDFSRLLIHDKNDTFNVQKYNATCEVLRNIFSMLGKSWKFSGWPKRFESDAWPDSFATLENMSGEVNDKKTSYGKKRKKAIERWRVYSRIPSSWIWKP